MRLVVVDTSSTFVRSVSPAGDVHALVSRMLLAISRLVASEDGVQADPYEAIALARISADAARLAASAMGKPVDLLIGRTSLQLNGEALRAPSWVYDAAWAIASRLTPGMLCAMYVPDTIEPSDVLALAKQGGAGTRIRAFGLPSHFASLVESQGYVPGLAENLAVGVAGVRTQLAAARDRQLLSLGLWTGLARAVAETCSKHHRWTSLAAVHALPDDSDAWIVIDTAVLAGCMTCAVTPARSIVYDSVLAVLMIAARRAWLRGARGRSSPDGTDLAGWLLGAAEPGQLPASCLMLVEEVGELARDGVQRGSPVRCAESTQGRIVEAAWRFAHEVATADGNLADRVDAAVRSQRLEADQATERGVWRLLLSRVGVLPSGTVVELSNGDIATLQAPLTEQPGDQVGALVVLDCKGSAGRDGTTEVALTAQGDRPFVVGVLDSVSRPAAELRDHDAKAAVPDVAAIQERASVPSNAPETNEGAERPRVFTDNELDSFLDEFVAWGESPAAGTDS